MTTNTPNLAQLSRAGSHPAVPRPVSRWKTRMLLPAAIALVTLALIAYSARAMIWPAVDVWVVPVVAAPDGSVAHSDERSDAAAERPRLGRGGSGGGAQVQAPGWIEPSPYPVIVPALADGVVQDVLVLEGERVDEGQVIARLIDADARLALARAEAELHEQHAMVDRARADADAAEAREKEIHIDVQRKEPLVESGAVSEGLVAGLRARLGAAKLETAAARSAVAVSEAGVARLEVSVREATLHLERMEVRAPKAGVVLALMVEPGQRLSMGGKEKSVGGGVGGGGMSGGIVRLYDPAMLQVRVDVPLADAAKVGAGSVAEITTEALPGRTFHGTVLRVMHEANIQRNTVQVKVSIDDPPMATGQTLKPEMLTRVRLSPPVSDGQSGAAPERVSASVGSGVGTGSAGLLLPASVLHDLREGKATVWLVDQSRGVDVRAVQRDVAIGGEAGDGYVRVISGLAIGDRVIVDAPASLRAGARVRVLGERAEKTAE